MEIIVGDIYCQVNNPRKCAGALALIRDVCKARPKDYMYMPKYKAGFWDGYISLMNGISKFPTGLLSFVTDTLESHNINYELLSLNGRSHNMARAVPDNALKGVTLREYQSEAVKSLLLATRGVAKMATNSGKTEIMAAIIWALDYPKTLVVTHMRDIMYQTAERFATRLGKDIGLIGDGVWEPGTVTVAMVQTLQSKIVNLDCADNQLLMVDECHHASSDQMMDVLFQIPGHYRYGFSGTPLKGDVLSDMKLMAVTGGLICEVTNKDLIDLGYSAKPDVIVYTIQNDSRKLWKLPYDEAYRALIVENPERNQKIVDIVESLKGVTMIMVNHISHGNILHDMMPSSTFVHGEQPTQHRKDILDAMRRSRAGIFIASPIFDEGVDVPAVNNLVIAGSGKSGVKLLQRVGRGLRSKGGDNKLTVVDFMDDTNKYLLAHSAERIEVYVQEGFATRLG